MELLKKYHEKGMNALHNFLAENMADCLEEKQNCPSTWELHYIIKDMMESLVYSHKLLETHEKKFTHEQAKQLVHKVGEHWTIEQTTAVAKQFGITFDKYSDWCFWAVMNMAYSDLSTEFKEDVEKYVKFIQNSNLLQIYS